MNADSKRLYRSRTDSMVCGVAGGMSEYFDVDPALMRIAWVVATVGTGGLGLVAYVIMAVVVRKEESQASDRSQVVRENLRDLPDEAERAGARVGEVLGATDEDAESDRSKRGRTLLGAVLVAVGAIFLLINLEVLSWWRWDIFWPVIVIGVGAALLLAHRSRGGG